MYTSKRKITEIIVHCTATPEGREVSVADVTKWHQARGWKTIGYHFLIGLDGIIHEGRSLDEVGAHCIGHNQHSIGVCYVGGLDKKYRVPKDTRTVAQKISLLKLINNLKFSFPNVSIYGHRDFDNKACPCFDAHQEYIEFSNK